VKGVRPEAKLDSCGFVGRVGSLEEDVKYTEGQRRMGNVTEANSESTRKKHVMTEYGRRIQTYIKDIDGEKHVCNGVAGEKSLEKQEIKGQAWRKR